MRNLKNRKFELGLIRGYADLLFRRGQLQVPIINYIQSFLDDFEKWVELKEEFNKKCTKNK